MSHELQLRKGGRLFSRRGDVTSAADYYLFEDCTLAANVTLRDVFRLLQAHETRTLPLLLGPWASQYTAEALGGRGKPYSGKYDPDGIEYLQLSKWLQVDRTSPWAQDRVEFGGVGFKLRAAHPDGWGKGKRIAWGVSGQSVQAIVNVPLRLASAYTVYDSTPGKHPSAEDDLTEYQGARFTLGQILHGVLWELTWHGSPEQRDARFAELKKRIAEIRDGETETVPLAKRKRRKP
jgi:hypothetical protein